MPVLRFMHTPAGRTLRIIAGLLLLVYGTLSPTLLGIVAMMAGVASIVTGLTRLPKLPPAPPRPREHSR